VPLYTSSTPYSMTYTNPTATTQTITAVAVSGTHISEFAAVPSSALPATIPPGATFTVDVTFVPAGLGLRAATLSATVAGEPTGVTTLLTGTGN